MQATHSPIHSSLREYGRGIAGGLLFSLPMLYTMEMWQFGFILAPARLLLFALASFVLLLGYNRYAGLHQNASWLEVAIDSVEEMGIGIVLSALFLTLLGQITRDIALSEAVGKSVVAGMTVAIGVSVGTAQLGAPQEGADAEDEQQGGDARPGERPSPFHEQLVIAFIAAILVAGNIAPTDEIEILGMHLGPLNLAGLAILSLGLIALILFFSDFARAGRHVPESITPTTIIGRSASFYVVALLVSALMLWFFGRFEGAGLMQCLSATLVLGLVASFGASAGRLLLH